MFSGLSGTYFAATGSSTTGLGVTRANFGATAFAHTPLAGFRPGFGPTSLKLPASLPSTRAVSSSPLLIAAASDVPNFSARTIGSLATARDIEFGGPGTVYGTTKTKGAPNLPTKARVVLLHQRSKQPVRETWSDPITGAFAFPGIDTTQQFLTLAEDAAGNFRPVAASRLVPEVLP